MWRWAKNKLVSLMQEVAIKVAHNDENGNKTRKTYFTFIWGIIPKNRMAES